MSVHGLDSLGHTELEKAAHRAAARTNADFKRVNLPVRAVVVKRASGARVELHQLARITRRAPGLTPRQLLARNVHTEMGIAVENIRAAGARQ